MENKEPNNLPMPRAAIDGQTTITVVSRAVAGETPAMACFSGTAAALIEIRYRFDLFSKTLPAMPGN
jgi:hypothetical protein